MSPVTLAVDDLAELLDLAAHELCGPHPHVAVGAGLDAPGEVTLSVVPLAVAPPAGLRGFDAPAGWWSLGVVHRTRSRRLCHVVDRQGRSATLGRHGGNVAPARLVHHPDQRVDDAVRCALGIPTPPPPCSAEHLRSLWWLDRVAQLALAAPATASPTWAAVEALRPVWGGTHAVLTHPHVRRHAVADLAHWFDDGAGARHLLAALPEPRELLADLAVLLDADVYERLEARLDLSAG